jgi:hypothetical protein
MAKTALSILKQAYALVKGGWVKGDSYELHNGHHCYCASGALKAAALGRIRPYGFLSDANKDALDAAGSFLNKAIPDDFLGIVSFNDYPGTAKTDVTKAFRDAIKLAEAA